MSGDQCTTESNTAQAAPSSPSSKVVPTKLAVLHAPDPERPLPTIKTPSSPPLSSTDDKATTTTTPTTSKPRKLPKRYNAFNIFFMLERQYLLHSRGGGIHVLKNPIDPSTSPLVRPAHPLKLPPLCPRYAHLPLTHNWFVEISYETLKGKREHRKTHGKISFKELAGTIAKNYRSIDSETKAFVHRISGLMDVHLRELRENYNDVDEGCSKDERGSLSRDGSLSLTVLKKHGKKRRKKKFVDNVAPVVSAPEVAGAKKKVREMMTTSGGSSPAHVGSAAAGVHGGSTPQMMELIQEQKRFLEERRRVIGGHQGVLSPSGVAHPQQQVYGVSTRSIPQVGPHQAYHGHGFRHPMPFGGQPRQPPVVVQRPAPHNSSDHEALVQQYMSQMRSGSATTSVATASSSTSPLAQGSTTSDYEAKLALFMSLKGNEGKPKSTSPPVTTQDLRLARSRSSGIASPEQLLEKTDEEINRLTLEMNHALRRRQEHERRIQALHGQLTPPLQQDHHSMRSFHPNSHSHHLPYHPHHPQQMVSTAAANMAQHHHHPQQYSHAHNQAGVGVLPPHHHSHPQASSSSQSHYLKMMSGLGSDYLARLESEVMEEALLRKLM